MPDDRIGATGVVVVLIFAALLWIAAHMDTEDGVYPSPSSPDTTEFTMNTVDIGTALVCTRTGCIELP